MSALIYVCDGCFRGALVEKKSVGVLTNWCCDVCDTLIAIRDEHPNVVLKEDFERALHVGEEFFVVQCFDDQGYVTSCRERTREAVVQSAAEKKQKSYVAMSLPFVGKWSSSQITDVTLPEDFAVGLATVNKRAREEA